MYILTHWTSAQSLHVNQCMDEATATMRETAAYVRETTVVTPEGSADMQGAISDAQGIAADMRESIAGIQDAISKVWDATATLRGLNANMRKTIVRMREVKNARRPLLSLPTELLQAIMAFIPDAVEVPSANVLRPIWHADVYDTAMIVPISQACKRLREVALGCPALWTSLTNGPHTRARVFAHRSQGIPLKVFLPIGQTIGHVLTDIAEDLPSRVQELHVGDMGPCEHTQDTLNHLVADGPFPLLESLSVQFCDNPLMDEEDQYHFGLPRAFTRECAPQLRRLCLGSCDFVSQSILASLTHLALHSVAVAHVHREVESMLSSCHVLESLHLENVQDIFNPPEPPPWDVDVHNFYHPTPAALPACRRLRRVTLIHVYGYLASFVIFLVANDEQDLALQLHDLKTDLNPALPRDRLLDRTLRLAVAMYPPPPNSGGVWMITAVSPDRTFRATSHTLQKALSPLLRRVNNQALAGVRELWLADVAALTLADGEKSRLSPREVSTLKAVVAAANLDTVVFANHFQTRWARGRPSLFLLPDTREAVAWPSISTLRIVYGYGPFLDSDWTPHEGVPPLDLSVILAELALGAYDYLEHLVIQVPRGVYVDPEEVTELQAYFETTRVEVVDETPTMALPEYCVEPAAWPQNVKKPCYGRLW